MDGGGKISPAGVIWLQSRLLDLGRLVGWLVGWLVGRPVGLEVGKGSGWGGKASEVSRAIVEGRRLERGDGLRTVSEEERQSREGERKGKNEIWAKRRKENA